MSGAKSAAAGVKPFLERLAEGVVVCDGAMGTMLYARGVFLNRCFDELNLSNPDLVRSVHDEYLEAGAEVIETNTFGAHRFKLGPHGLEAQVRKINREGARIAREAAEGRALVAGAIGPDRQAARADRQHPPGRGAVRPTASRPRACSRAASTSSCSRRMPSLDQARGGARGGARGRPPTCRWS